MNILFLAASVLLSWQPVNGADHYELCISPASMAGGAKPTSTTTTTETTYTVQNLTVGKTYYFYVKTWCPYGTLLGTSNEITYVAK